MSEPNERDRQVFERIVLPSGRIEHLAAYREELETKAYLRGCRDAEEKARDIARLTAPAPAQAREDSDGSLSWCNCERCQANRDHSAPAQSREEEAQFWTLLEETLKDYELMRDASRGRKALAALAALRSRQSPQAAAVSIDDLRSFFWEFHDERPEAYALLDDAIGAITAGRWPEAAPQPSPQGEDSVELQSTLDWLDGHDSTTRSRDALILRDEVLRLRARLASLDAAKDGGEWISIKDDLPPNGEMVEIRGYANRTGGKRSTLWALGNTCVTYWRRAALERMESARSEPYFGGMRTLSIRQPWAWLIVNGWKDIENRSWATEYRGDFLIHAGKGMTRDEYYEARILVAGIRDLGGFPSFDGLQRGGIVGASKIVDCVRESSSPWFFGPCGFVLKDSITIPFVPCKGQQGFFEYEGAIEREGGKGV